MNNNVLPDPSSVSNNIPTDVQAIEELSNRCVQGFTQLKKEFEGINIQTSDPILRKEIDEVLLELKSIGSRVVDLLSQNTSMEKEIPVQNPVSPEPIPQTEVPEPAIIRSEGDVKKKRSIKELFRKYWIVLVVLVGIVIIATIVFLMRHQIMSLLFPMDDLLGNYPVGSSVGSDFSDIDYYEDLEEESSTPKVEFLNNSQLSFSKVRQLCDKYDELEGDFTYKDIDFDHTETYKGIEIAWMNGTPINSERLQWLKDAIDVLPPLFLEQYPISGFYSVGQEDVPDEWMSTMISAGAFATKSGIFLTPVMADEYLASMYEQMQKEEFIQVIFHEWAHVIQYYDIFYTFNEDYLDSLVEDDFSITSIFESTQLLGSFGRIAGWEYEYPDIEDCYDMGWCIDEYSYCYCYWANGPSLPENPDAEFLKTTEYGKMIFSTTAAEDMADTFSYYITCDKTVEFSDARIKWMKDFLGKSQQYYCDNSVYK